MKKLGMIMDPIQLIQAHHDSSFAILIAAQARGLALYYIEPHDLYAEKNTAFAITRRVTVTDNATSWFDLAEPVSLPLAELDFIFMRKDPPFNLDYIYLTYLLELAELQGVKIINSPAALRDANEKAFILQFPDCIAPTLVSSNSEKLRQFIIAQQQVILKPLDGMGGQSIFYVTPDDKNLSVILETMTGKNRTLIMAQRYLPEIKNGDKRIILIDGEPIPYAFARFAAPNESRANIAAGGSGKCIPLTARDYWLCQQIAPTLRQKGLFLVGLDVIGDFITEINVTSPTCLREIARETGVDAAALLIEKLIK